MRIECCTICGSDLHTITGARDEPVPSVLGHEIVGAVCALGDHPASDIDGRRLELGDRVTWSTCISCGRCDRCQQGMPQKCRYVAKYGHMLAEKGCALSGGMAQHILLRPGSAIVRVDPSIPSDVICPANCATATMAAAFRVAGRVDGRRVLILGAGMLGLTAAAMARAGGASRVTVCDPNTKRLRLANQFGADGCVEWCDEHNELRRRLSAASNESDPAYDIILEVSGVPEAAEAACELGDTRARIIMVGSVMRSRKIEVDPERVVRHWYTIHGVHNYTPDDLCTAVDFLTQFHERFPFAQLVEQSFPLGSVNEAIEMALRERPIRIAIRPS